MTELLSTRKLSKRYGSKYALKDADIHIHQGDIYGLIGRNGAGKTTLLKLINSQMIPSAGTVVMQGQTMRLGQPRLRIGALVESPGLYPDYDARDNLLFKAIATGRNSKAHIDGLLKLVEMQDTGKKKAKQFSLGMKQRLGIALAMVEDPQLLILDEPINGMDPQGIKDIRETLVKINREMGTTILISSHILDELAKFATTYGIIKDGELIREFTRQQLEQDTRGSIEIRSPEIVKVRAALQGLGIDQTSALGEDGLMLRQGIDRHQQISRRLFDQGIYLTQYVVRHESLEDYFMGMTGGTVQ